MNVAMHEVTPEEIMALQDGELSGERAKSVVAHLDACVHCKEIQDSLSATSAALRTWDPPTAPENSNFESRLFDIARNVRSQEQAAGVRQFAPFFRRHWLLTAASAALTVGLVFTLWTVTLQLQSSSFSGSARSQVISDQHSKIFSNRLESPRSRVSSDSNGLVHGLGDHAKDSFSADGTLGKLGQSGLAGRDHSGWVPNGPMVARTVSLSVVAKDFTGSRAALDGILARHHGYAATLAVSTEQNTPQSLQASLRVPAAELGAVLGELKSLGRIENERQNGEEVTQQHADLLARLKNSRETEIRLQDILRNRTGKISDVLAVEQEIARVRVEIEEMEAERTNLEHRVDYATVDLNLSEEYKAQLGGPAASISTRFHNAAVSGLRNALDTVVGVALYFTEVGPSLVIWLIVILPVTWFFWRRWKRSYALAGSGSL